MVTDYQLLNAITSLAYRRRLLEGMGDVEQTIHKYLAEHELTRVRISGYDVLTENGQIRLEEAPIMDVNQLRLPLHTNTHNDQAP